MNELYYIFLQHAMVARCLYLFGYFYDSSFLNDSQVAALNLIKKKYIEEALRILTKVFNNSVLAEIKLWIFGTSYGSCLFGQIIICWSINELYYIFLQQVWVARCCPISITSYWYFWNQIMKTCHILWIMMSLWSFFQPVFSVSQWGI